MIFFSIGNLRKEVQGIKFDIEHDCIGSAMDRCDSLDELFCAIEDKYRLGIEDVVLVK